jgi:hypothetical protein
LLNRTFAERQREPLPIRPERREIREVRAVGPA